MGVLSGIDNITGWALLQKNSAAIEKSYAAGSSSAADIAYFQKIAPTLTTPDALLKNYRALTFVATAYGLGSEVDQTAILKKLMTQDPKATTSLAQQLSDNNYRNFAAAMSVWAPPPFSSQSTIDAAIAGFKQHSFDTSVGTDSTSLQSAMYFTQNAKGVTSIYQLMSDPALLNVVTTALGIPAAFGNLSFQQQVDILTPRVDMKQFATTAGVATFVNKYLAMDQLNQITSGATASDPLLALFGSSNNGGDGSGSQGLTLSAQLLTPGNTLNLIA
jgi:hypothetical protein